MNEISKTLKPSFCKVLCHIRLLRRKDRLMNTHKKTASAFEDCLDIRKLVAQQINLALLIRLLLNKRQQFLFMHQNARNVTDTQIRGSSSDNDADQWELRRSPESTD